MSPGPERQGSPALFRRRFPHSGNNGGQYATADKARNALADKRAGIHAGSRTAHKSSQARHEARQPRTADTADSSGDGIARRTKTEILGRRAKTVATNGTGHKLDNDRDNCFHSVPTCKRGAKMHLPTLPSLRPFLIRGKLR